MPLRACGSIEYVSLYTILHEMSTKVNQCYYYTHVTVFQVDCSHFVSVLTEGGGIRLQHRKQNKCVRMFNKTHSDPDVFINTSVFKDLL